MEAIRLSGKPSVEVQVRKSSRARRLSLRVSQLDGRVTLTVPNRVPQRTAEAFVLEREDWILRHLSGAIERVTVAPGMALPIGGVPRRIEATASGRAVEPIGAVLRVPPDRPAGPALRAYVKELARAQLSAAAHRAAEAYGAEVTRLDLRDPRSRWGSCSSAGRLMFSWRLALAPAEVASYVAIHEAAHLREMNHGPRFWRLVEDLCPDWKTHRSWLRSEGVGLHRFDFDGDR